MNVNQTKLYVLYKHKNHSVDNLCYYVMLWKMHHAPTAKHELHTHVTLEAFSGY